jgi:DNA-binding response OmpR family regulator
MDVTTNVIRWRGETLQLSQDDRQTLRVLLQHAGQILSCEQLASLLSIASDAVDLQIRSLRLSLEASGVTLVPRRAEGCGYILWR